MTYPVALCYISRLLNKAYWNTLYLSVSVMVLLEPDTTPLSVIILCRLMLLLLVGGFLLDFRRESLEETLESFDSLMKDSESDSPAILLIS